MAAQDDQVVYPVSAQAGIKRDGTSLDGNYYSDGLWCRFRNGRPKKIGGYQEIINLNSVSVPAHVPTKPARAIETCTASPMVMIHAFHGDGVSQIAADQNAVGGACLDRTPAGFTAGDYVWTTDHLWDSVGGATKIVAHAANCLGDITSDTKTDIYYGTNIAAAALTSLTASGAPQVSGGICVLQPFVFAFGSDGLIANCDANKPTIWSGGQFNNSANVAGTKIVAGMSLRGGANAPAGLFWALDSLIRVSFIGGSAIWRYDTLSDQTTILASKCVVEVDGTFYWPGIDRFLMYNGVVKELSNPLNQDFFFDNLNWTHRNKVWGIKVTRWGEIWWFFPKSGSTECNHAVIYNYRENTWYDTPILRSGGCAPRELPLLLWADSVANTDGSGGVTGFRLYRHEIGKDAVVNGQVSAIRSYWESSNYGLATGGVTGQGQENPNVLTRTVRVEPDYVGSGPLEISLRGTSFAMDTQEQQTDPVTFEPRASESVADFRTQIRLPRLRVESNTQGGDYFFGKTLLHNEPGDEHP